MILELLLMIFLQAILWLIFYLMFHSFLIFLESQLKFSFKNKFTSSGVFACIICFINLLLITLGYQ